MHFLSQRNSPNILISSSPSSLISNAFMEKRSMNIFQNIWFCFWRKPYRFGQMALINYGKMDVLVEISFRSFAFYVYLSRFKDVQTFLIKGKFFSPVQSRSFANGKMLIGQKCKLQKSKVSISHTFPCVYDFPETQPIKANNRHVKILTFSVRYQHLKRK